MAIQTVKITKKTRGVGSREIEFDAIGKYVPVTYNREKQQKIDENGKPVVDEDGEPVMEYIGKDEKGNQITREEVIDEFESAGAVADFTDFASFAEKFTGGDSKKAEQLVCDWAAAGYNDWAFKQEVNRDEFADFIRDLGLDDEKANQFRRSARMFAKTAEISNSDAALMLATNMKKKLKKSA